ncbi:response regulator [Crocosphaera sp. Alani8]|uniref:response regulator n=1 Tax=Crocosphaera sp. Alani8 TaxID=3038952 RepID=UPI00313BCCC7
MEQEPVGANQIDKLQQEIKELKQKNAHLESLLNTESQQKKLQNQVSLFQLVLDNIPSLIFWKDRDSVFQGCNQQWAKAAGFKHPQEIIGKTDYDLYPKTTNVAEYIAKDRYVIDSGEPQYHVEYKSEKDVWYDTRKIPIRDHQGNIVGILATIEDITKRKKAEERLRIAEEKQREKLEEKIAEKTKLMRQEIAERKEKEKALKLILQGTAKEIGNAFFNALVKNLSEVINVSCGFIGEIEYSKNQLNILSFWSNKVLINPFTINLQEFDCENICDLNFYECLISNNRPVYDYLSSKGLLVRHDWIYPLFNVSGDVIGILGILDKNPIRLDDSKSSIFQIFAARAGAELERKQVQFALVEAKQAAEIASQAKSAFIANMSHELRTPLNAIIGFAQLLDRDSTLKPEQKKQIQTINRSGENLLSLINDILEIAKIEAGKIELTTKTFDLYSLLNEVKDLFLLKAKEKGLQLTFSWSSSLPKYISTDQGKLRQVLINLLGNSIKFTQQGTVALKIRFNQEETSIEKQGISSKDCLLWFDVEDTGVGIADDETDKLFLPFEQTETGRNSFQGTGLGLAISRKFIELMGGEIEIKSTVGMGTRVTFMIPVDTSTSEVIINETSPQKVIALAPDKPIYRILVVDDHTSSRSFLRQMLSLVGFEVNEASNGQEAINCWQTWHPHLILMDIRMPIMNGYEATKYIKSTPNGKATVIIALTASAFDEQKKQILAIGCNDFIAKPFSEAIIWEKLAQYLGVSYLYEEVDNKEELNPIEQEEKTELDSGKVLVESLLTLSEEWKEQLYEQAKQLNRKQVLKLIEEIPEHHTTLIETLTNLAQNYKFTEIAELVQS